MKQKIILKNIIILVSIYLLGCISSFIAYYRASISFEEILSLFNTDTYVEEIAPTLVQNTQPEELEDISEVENEPDSVCTPVDVSGAVRTPGVFCMEEKSLIVDALKKAGGFTKDAAYKYISMNINLSQVLKSNMKIYIPYTKDLYCETVEFEIPSKIVKVINPVVDDPQTETPSCVNINSGTKEELESLNGVGSSTAQKIIDGRPYENLEDILNVSGIGDSTYEKFKDDICL